MNYMGRSVDIEADSLKHHIYNITNLHCTECPESQSRQEPAVQTYSSESSDTAGGRRMCDVVGW